MRPKGAKGAVHQPPIPGGSQGGPPEPQILAIHGLWQPPAQVQQAFPSSQGKSFPSFMDPALQETGMGHIWCYIPLYTIFPQKSNGEILKTQLFHLKSCHQPISPFQRKDSSYSSGQCIVESTIQGYQLPGPPGVGVSFKQYSLKGILA
ncbi:hypothetical protein O181_115842 [Austropuccinia psidii MF-1]|uniref:Uncharacterized protein n=1 Tax=Austropuccinia psidii MF-1 TaxID=1389203 RepID=A0A9Q3PXS5_9BASI|nr:hypothetical protein [Austropuccinia psidii MF-1]